MPEHGYAVHDTRARSATAGVVSVEVGDEGGKWGGVPP